MYLSVGLGSTEENYTTGHVMTMSLLRAGTSMNAVDNRQHLQLITKELLLTKEALARAENDISELVEMISELRDKQVHNLINVQECIRANGKVDAIEKCLLNYLAKWRQSLDSFI